VRQGLLPPWRHRRGLCSHLQSIENNTLLRLKNKKRARERQKRTCLNCGPSLSGLTVETKPHPSNCLCTDRAPVCIKVGLTYSGLWSFLLTESANLPIDEPLLRKAPAILAKGKGSAMLMVILSIRFIDPTTVIAQSPPPASLGKTLPSASTVTKDATSNSNAGVIKTPDLFASAAEKGIYFTVFLNEEVAGNPLGGIRQGIAASQYVVFGPDLDMQRLLGWQGGAIHALAIAENSTGLSQKYIGGGVDVQENFAPFNFFRFLDLTVEQKISLWDEASLDLVAGRTAAVPAFGESEYASMFMNHAFSGPLFGFTQSSGTAVAPLASWGGKAKLEFTPDIYLQFGGYAVDEATLESGTQIFDLDTRRVTGVNYLWEVGYETTFSDDPSPRYYRIGFSYLDAPRNDVLLNTSGLPLFEFGGAPLTHHGETAIYVTGGRVIWRPDLSTHRNIALFGSVYYNLVDSEAIQYALKWGLVQTGPFAVRPNDTLCLGMAMISFTSKDVESLSGMRSNGGGTGRVPGQEWIVELNYGCQLAPGVVVRPNLQYIIKPDPGYTPTYPRNIPNAFVIGLQITASLDTLFGLPHIGH
jgi:porin